MADRGLRAMNEEERGSAEGLRAATARYQAAIAELAEVNADLTSLVDSTGAATIFLNRELAIRRFTPRAAEVLDLSPEDAGRPLGEVARGLEYPELVRDARGAVKRLVPTEREVRSRGERWFTVRIAPYRTAGDRVGGAVVTLIDTTDRRRMEAEKARAWDEARQARKAKSNFLGVLSHEFCTPLTAVIGYAERLERRFAGTVDEQALREVRILKQAGSHLKDMVDEMLMYARLERRTESIRVTRVDPAQVAADVTALVEEQARIKGLEFRLELASDLPEVRTDEGKLSRILLHLLGNAVRFTDEGHVVQRVAAQDARVVFEVEDTGIGIAAVDQRRIFEPFEQAFGGEVMRPGGTGLGLAVVQKLALLIGGEVTLQSEVGRGSRFTVRIPPIAP